MSGCRSLLVPTAVLALLAPTRAGAGVAEMAICQKAIAREGAKFAQRVVKYTLACTTKIAECQIECEQGAFGPPCSSNPPPCCDPDDPSSNAAFGQCMGNAQSFCNEQDSKIDSAETKKQGAITNACSHLTQDELCSSQARGLNFETLNAGCRARDPSYVCNLQNLVACVGGPLERQLLDQISATLHPRAGEAITALGLQSRFPDIPTVRKVRNSVGAGRVDVWRITGDVDEPVRVTVQTRDDGGGSSRLHPLVTLLGADATTPIVDTTVLDVGCAVPPVCGSRCPIFQRRLPSSGSFHLAVAGVLDVGCPGGGYELIVESQSGVVPTLVLDASPSGAFVTEAATTR